MNGSKTELKGLYPEELEAFVVSQGLERYRARQIAAWVYNRGLTSFDDMTDISKAVRQQLDAGASILALQVASRVESEAGPFASRPRWAARWTAGSAPQAGWVCCGTCRRPRSWISCWW